MEWNQKVKVKTGQYEGMVGRVEGFLKSMNLYIINLTCGRQELFKDYELEKILDKNMIKGTDLGQKLRRIRRAKNITLKDLSERVNVPYATMINYEQGNTAPQLDNLRKIANELGYEVVLRPLRETEDLIKEDFD